MKKILLLSLMTISLINADELSVSLLSKANRGQLDMSVIDNSAILIKDTANPINNGVGVTTSILINNKDPEQNIIGVTIKKGAIALDFKKTPKGELYSLIASRRDFSMELTSPLDSANRIEASLKKKFPITNKISASIAGGYIHEDTRDDKYIINPKITLLGEYLSVIVSNPIDISNGENELKAVASLKYRF